MKPRVAKEADWIVLTRKSLVARSNSQKMIEVPLDLNRSPRLKSEVQQLRQELQSLRSPNQQYRYNAQPYPYQQPYPSTTLSLQQPYPTNNLMHILIPTKIYIKTNNMDN